MARLGMAGAALVVQALAMVLGGAAEAAPLDAAFQTQLLQLYDQFNQAITAGKVDEAVALRSSEARKSLRPYLGSKAKRRELVETISQVIPDTIEVKHASLAKDGKSAEILTVVTKKAPAKTPKGGPPPGSVMAMELTLDFVMEAGQWRLGDTIFGMDPTKIVPCKNPAFEPIDAYDDGKNVELGGPIVSVDFETDYTLVVVRVLDEENCAYMPNREAIEKAGLNLDLLVPYAIAEISGLPHKTDPQKVWVDHITVHED
ncbi:MAG TPA: hypothetical protein VKU84_04000 [Stellaceae bacterium]|nr:hypothetical protein [Stellaceae bacterium]